MRIFITLMACFLWSCSQHRVSDIKNPKFNLPQEFYNKAKYSPKNNESWQKILTNSNLQKLFKLAIENNFNLKKSQLKVQQSALALSAAKSNQLPTGNVSFTQQTNKISRVGGVDVDNSTTSAGLSAGISWELDLWKKLSSVAKANRWLNKASEQEMQSMLFSIKGNIIEVWLKIRASTAISFANKKQLVIQKQQYELAKLNAINGNIEVVELLQQENNLLLLQQQQQVNLQNLAQLENNLSVLVGMPRQKINLKWQGLNTNKLFSDVDLVEFSMPENLSPAYWLQSHPSIRASLYRLQAADNQIAVAIANYWPSITLSLAQSLTGVALASLRDNITRTGKLAVASSLLNFPSLQNEVKNKRIKFKIAYTDFNQTVITTLKDIEDALIVADSIFKQLGLIKLQYKISQQLFKQAEIKYNLGVMPYNIFVGYSNSNHKLYINMINMMGNYIVAHKNLLLAIGFTGLIKS